MALVHEQAAAEAAKVNPDGWAVDPEALLATEEFLWETEHFKGVEAALSEARRQWKVCQAQFRAATDVVRRGDAAAHVLLLEELGAALAARMNGEG